MKSCIAISDTHLQITLQRLLRNVEADFLFIAGDSLSGGRALEFAEFLDQLRRIRSQFKNVVLIPGNHCIYMENETQFCRKQLLDAGVDFLVNQIMWIDGLKIAGVPWTPAFGRGWAFQIPRGTEEKWWTETSKSRQWRDMDILLSHGPAKGILDLIPDSYVRPGETNHVGDPGLRAVLDKGIIKPRLLITGHTHTQGHQNTVFFPAYGEELPEGVDRPEMQCYNVAICTEGYKAINPITCFDIEAGRRTN